jgi:hemin uptake protein HemP
LNNSKLKSDNATAAPPSNAPRVITVDANRIDSRDLFLGTRELTIGHGNDTYRLRLTAQNKLILTK